MRNRRNIILVAAVLLVVVAGVVTILNSQTPSRFRSVEDLVGHIEDRGPRCGGPLEVSAGKVGGDGPYYEAGNCDRFANYDVANFYWFPDHGAMEAYIAHQGELVEEWDFDGVLGANWFASVRSEETAREVQEVVGGEVHGY